MFGTVRAAIVFAALLGAGEPSFALDVAGVPDAKRTAQGLYLTADDVPPFLASHKAATSGARTSTNSVRR